MLSENPISSAQNVGRSRAAATMAETSRRPDVAQEEEHDDDRQDRASISDSMSARIALVCYRVVDLTMDTSGCRRPKFRTAASTGR